MKINNISHISLTKSDITKLIQIVSEFAKFANNSQTAANIFSSYDINRSNFMEIYNPSITIIEDSKPITK
mgnify:CR=1 FL=1